MTIFFAIMLGGYFLLLIAFKIGWRKIIRHPSPKGDQVNSITVLVPFRNEAKNLGRLCESLSRIRYSTENWQVIFINDHSTDNSVEIIESSIRNEPRFLLVHLDDRQEGKKNALTFGVNRAQGDIIVATDADCYLPENWLTIINTFFKEDNIRLAFGGVRLKADDSFFSRLQSIEFLSLIGSGGATLGLGFFSMCNGANLAFRKSAFEAVNGYDGNLKIASGDDEFLARKILLNFPGSVRFINVAEAVVETE
ncbi:MAG: glycosyltransferase, partial [Cyclobacteriaceae bacterium]